MKNLFLALLMILALVLPGCAANTIRPVDGITINYQADIDAVDGGVKIEPVKLGCEGEKLLPFPTGKLGGICDAVRGSDSGDAVGEGSVLEGGSSEGAGDPVLGSYRSRAPVTITVTENSNIELDQRGLLFTIPFS